MPAKSPRGTSPRFLVELFPEDKDALDLLLYDPIFKKIAFGKRNDLIRRLVHDFLEKRVERGVVYNAEQEIKSLLESCLDGTNLPETANLQAFSITCNVLEHFGCSNLVKELRALKSFS